MAEPEKLPSYSRRLKSPPPKDPAAFTVDEFCAAHRIGRAKLYKLWAQGVGPQLIKIGTKNLISAEAAAAWRAARERDGAVAA